MFGQTIKMFGQTIEMFGQTIEMFGQTIEMFGQTIEMFGYKDRNVRAERWKCSDRTMEMFMQNDGNSNPSETLVCNLVPVSNLSSK
jgi:hypothetical protein